MAILSIAIRASGDFDVSNTPKNLRRACAMHAASITPLP
jgi:hypothetical protein